MEIERIPEVAAAGGDVLVGVPKVAAPEVRVEDRGADGGAPAAEDPMAGLSKREKRRRKREERERENRRAREYARIMRELRQKMGERPKDPPTAGPPPSGGGG